MVGWAVAGIAGAAATPIYNGVARVEPGKLRVLSGDRTPAARLA